MTMPVALLAALLATPAEVAEELGPDEESEPDPDEGSDESEAAEEPSTADLEECGRCGTDEGPLVLARTAEGYTVWCAPCLSKAARDPAQRSPVGGGA